jgi:hypothetical protein
LQLISHPIFSKSTKSRNKDIGFSIDKISFDKKDNRVIIKSKIKAKELPYAIVALIRPFAVSEYFNMSFSSIVKTHEVTIELEKVPKGKYFLQQQFLFADGTTRKSNSMIIIDDDGKAETIKLRGQGEVDVQRLYNKFKALEETNEVKMILENLSGILNPPEPINLKTVKNDKVFLSDAKWEKATVGWDKVARNYFSLESEFKFFLLLQKKVYNKGLYAHSPASYIFNLERKWKTFSATIGIRDNAHIEGSAIFKVFGDGKLLFESPVLRVNEKDEFKVDISNIKTLKLQTIGSKGHVNNSWAIWVDPIIER